MTSKRFEHSKASFALPLFNYLKEKKSDHGYGSTPDETFAKIAALDPTSSREGSPTQHSYLHWLCENLLKEKPRVEDIYKVKNNLTLFIRNNQTFDKKKRTIGHYNLETLADAVFPFIDQLEKPTSKEQYEIDRLAAEQQSTIIYDGPAGRILSPHTMEASQFWGRGTTWCISATKSDNLFEEYTESGPILMFLPKGTREKFAISMDDPDGLRDMQDKPEQGVSKSLLDLLVSASQGGIDEKNVSEAEKDVFRMVLMRKPELYHAMLTAGSSNSPDFLSPEKVLELLSDVTDFRNGEYMGNKKLGYLDFDETTSFILHPRILDCLLNNQHGDKFERLKSDVKLSKADGLKLLDFKVSMFDLSPESLKDIAYAKDTSLKAVEAILAYGGSLPGTAEGDPVDDCIVAIAKKLPAEVWEDPDFSLKFLSKIEYYPSVTCEALPAAYRHPEVVAGMVKSMSIEDIDNYSVLIDPEIWNYERNGKPFFESILPEKLESIEDAWDLYDLASRGDGVDYTPLARLLDGLYPNGFDDDEDLETSLVTFNQMNMDTLLERTIRAHPEFFDMIPLERQTDKMAQLAVAHDPEMLIEVADRLIKKDPSKFLSAFNALGLNNPIRQAREHYFAGSTADNGPQGWNPPESR